MPVIVPELPFIAESIRVIEYSLPASPALLLFTLIFELRFPGSNCKFIVIVKISKHVCNHFLVV